MKKQPLELIVEAAFAVRSAHQSMRSSGGFSKDDISAVIWHESKLWDLYQEHQTELETNKIYKEAGQ